MRQSRIQLAVSLSGLIVAFLIAGMAYRWAHTRVGGPTISNWRDYALSERALDDDAGAVTITVFTDYQCPHCLTLDKQLTALRSRYPGALRLIVRHYPVESRHPFARAAALAVECATESGQRKVVHYGLFALQDALADTLWGRIAMSAGIGDTTAFRTCINEGKFSHRIDADLEAAQALGISGTPTMLINEHLIRGVSSLESLDQVVQAALDDDLG